MNIQINGGANWQPSGIFNNLAPGNYDVRIRDAVNQACEIVLNPALTITEPAILNAIVTGTDVTCFGANDGLITITNPTGGYGTLNTAMTAVQHGRRQVHSHRLLPVSYDVRIRDRAHIVMCHHS